MDIIPAGEHGATLSFDEDEAAVMRDLTEQLHDIVTQDDATDPVVGRLYPPAHDSAEEERKYRELVGSELKGGKLQAVDTLQRALGESGPVRVMIREQDVDPWLTALTDMRLAIGTRMDVTEEKMNEELDP